MCGLLRILRCWFRGHLGFGLVVSLITFLRPREQCHLSARQALTLRRTAAKAMGVAEACIGDIDMSFLLLNLEL